MIELQATTGPAETSKSSSAPVEDERSSMRRGKCLPLPVVVPDARVLEIPVPDVSLARKVRGSDAGAPCTYFARGIDLFESF